jgi:hypothetical protein
MNIKYQDINLRYKDMKMRHGAIDTKHKGIYFGPHIKKKKNYLSPSKTSCFSSKVQVVTFSYGVYSRKDFSRPCFQHLKK